jgi:hypothetical protein
MGNMRVFRFCDLISAGVLLGLAGCGAAGTTFPNTSGAAGGASIMGGARPAPVIRQPVLPEYLVGCRGHVLVPSLGMNFISKGAPMPTEGQYVREESLTAPYRVIRPGDRMSQDRSPARLNVELDSFSRVIGLACG